jgi:hypothetical protein
MEKPLDEPPAECYSRLNVKGTRTVKRIRPIYSYYFYYFYGAKQAADR